MTDRDAFESAIDANPFESTTHGAYADWLDEHDMPDEAAFRRSMGRWMQRQNPQEISPNKRRFTVWGPWSVADLPEDVSKFAYIHHPEWIQYPYHWGNEISIGPNLGSGISRQPHHPEWIQYHEDVFPHAELTSHNPMVPNGLHTGGRFEWPNYRAMEQSFRESFMNNRKKQMSRKQWMKNVIKLTRQRARSEGYATT